MSRIRHAGGRVWEKMLKESGVDAFNGAQGRILYVLWEHGAMTITEIGRLTSLAKTTLTSMLDRMQESGLIMRSPDRNNRRQIIVSVTDKAEEYREVYERLSERMNALTYAGFSESELLDYERKLNRVLGNLEKGE